jgi:hypothetical protein
LRDTQTLKGITHTVWHVDKFRTKSTQLNAVKPNDKQLETGQVDSIDTAAIDNNGGAGEGTTNF